MRGAGADRAGGGTTGAGAKAGAGAGGRGAGERREAGARAATGGEGRGARAPATVTKICQTVHFFGDLGAAIQHRSCTVNLIFKVGKLMSAYFCQL